MNDVELQVLPDVH